jgi:hypothetical protein
MTLASRFSRLFSLVQTGSASGRAVPRLNALRLSNHDLSDLNLPPEYRTRLDLDRTNELIGLHR